MSGNAKICTEVQLCLTAVDMSVCEPVQQLQVGFGVIGHTLLKRHPCGQVLDRSVFNLCSGHVDECLHPGEFQVRRRMSTGVPAPDVLHVWVSSWVKQAVEFTYKIMTQELIASMHVSTDRTRVCP